MADMFTIGMILSAVDQASGVINRMCNNALTDLGKVQAKMLAVSESMKQIGKEALAAGLMTTGAIQKPLRIFADLDEAQRDLKTNIMDSAGAVGKELEEM